MHDDADLIESVSQSVRVGHIHFQWFYSSTVQVCLIGHMYLGFKCKALPPAGEKRGALIECWVTAFEKRGADPKH
jgi:hypothetical protein